MKSKPMLLPRLLITHWSHSEKPLTHTLSIQAPLIPSLIATLLVLSMLGRAPQPMDHLPHPQPPQPQEAEVLKH